MWSQVVLGSIAMHKASGGDGIPAELFQILKDDAMKVLHSICQQIWKTQQWPQDWKRSVFIPIPKKDNAKECSYYFTIALISHASKAMLKILQARLQQYMNYKLPDIQDGFRKGRGTRDQTANIHWIIEKAREFQKKIYLCFIDFAKDFDCVHFSSVQFSHSVVSDSLWPHESQHARLPCPSPTPGVHSDPRPSSQWCHPAISSSVIPFSSCPQSLPASKSFPMSQLFSWGGQSTGVSAWITTNCRKFFKNFQVGIDHLTGLLRNLHAGQEATVRTRYGKTDWFQIGKGVRQGCILTPCLSNLYAE